MKIVRVLKEIRINKNISELEEYAIDSIRRFDYGTVTVVKRDGYIHDILLEEHIIFENGETNRRTSECSL